MMSSAFQATHILAIVIQDPEIPATQLLHLQDDNDALSPCMFPHTMVFFEELLRSSIILTVQKIKNCVSCCPHFVRMIYWGCFVPKLHGQAENRVYRQSGTRGKKIKSSMKLSHLAQLIIIKSSSSTKLSSELA